VLLRKIENIKVIQTKIKKKPYKSGLLVKTEVDIDLEKII